MKLHLTSPETLSQVLLRGCPGCSKNSLRSWLQHGRILVDGKPAKSLTMEIPAGSVVSLGPKKKFAEGGLTIYFEDENIIVIDKPAGLLSVATIHQKANCVHDILKKRYHTRRVYPVHRLDRDTSGILVFAYTEQARDHLKKQFEEHTIEREYCALVQGSPLEKEGTWRSYLVEEKNYYVRSTSDNRGRLAITHYKVLKTNDRFALLSLRLETGRKNQIRVQAKDAGYPIVGDEKYNPILTEEEHRLCLHATRLAFEHPVTRKTLSYMSPPPNFFNRLVR